MRYQASEFKLFDRGFDDTMLLIPGWATDYRIFAPLDVEFNYLISIKLSPFDFRDKLLDSLSDNRSDVISILGWSMGYFLALDFASEYPDRINNGIIFMVSARCRYEKALIEGIKIRLRKNRAGYLYKFYKECFSEGEKESLYWFKSNLLSSYINEMNLDVLFKGLDYLSNAQIKTHDLKKVNITFLHGESDKIAPIEEALKISKNLPQAKFISIKGAGHIPFLRSNFNRILHEALVR